MDLGHEPRAVILPTVRAAANVALLRPTRWARTLTEGPSTGTTSPSAILSQSLAPQVAFLRPPLPVLRT